MTYAMAFMAGFGLAFVILVAMFVSAAWDVWK